MALSGSLPRAAISLAKRVRTEAQCLPNATTYLLSGVILMSGFYVPLEESVLKSETYLYQLKLVDSRGRDMLTQRFELIKNLSRENTTKAVLLLAQTAMNMNIGGKSLFSNLTGYSHQGSILHPTLPEQIWQYINYVNTTEFKEKLHIWPNATLDGYRLPLSLMLAPNDFFNNITSTLEDVLSSERFLIINGQMDDVFPPATFERCMHNLSWTYSKEFQDAERKPWLARPTCEMAGYVTETKNLVNALLLRAGHNLALDMRDATNDLVNRFVNNISFF